MLRLRRCRRADLSRPYLNHEGDTGGRANSADWEPDLANLSERGRILNLIHVQQEVWFQSDSGTFFFPALCLARP